MTFNLAVAATGAALVLAVVHLLYLSRRTPLSRPQAYTIGVAVLLAGFWLWAWLESEVQAAVALTVITGTGGVAVRLLWWWNASKLPRETWPGQRLTPAQLRLRMIELIENMQSERAIAKGCREEADQIEERVDFYLRFMREPANWKPDTSLRDVRRAMAQEGQDGPVSGRQD